MNSNWSYSPETLNSGQNWRIFVTSELKIWWMTLENNRAPLLYFIKLCASFQNHGWIQTGVTARKRSIRVKIGIFSSSVTLKFDGWHWKTIGQLLNTTSSCVHHFKAMGEFKLELQSGNSQFGSKSAIFYPYELEIWRITLKNNSAPLLCCFKLCASFHSHQWIQTRVRKCPIWVKIDVSCIVWPWNLTDDLEKKLCASFQSHGWIQTGVTVWKGPIRWFVSAVWPWNLTDDLEKQ